MEAPLSLRDPARDTASCPFATALCVAGDRLFTGCDDGAVHVWDVGRDEAASPATGSGKVHQSEQQEIVDQALDLRSQEVVLQTVGQAVSGQASG